MLNDKNILLCVTGGIAVFKAAALTSKLTQAGAAVKVLMSDSAQKFVTPLTFQALSRNDVYTETFDEKNPEVISHIDLADWADLILIAPATANVIGKLANGIADDMLTTTLLAATAPVWIAPAMNVHMYSHPAVQRNMDQLIGFGYEFLEPSEGFLACGYVGKGRLEEPETIVARLSDYFSGTAAKPLAGRNIVVTAGPTREKIDPVRFISNHSTGKMGYALARQAAALGADVKLISGPVQIPAPPGVSIIKVESAAEMYEEALKAFPTADAVVKTAAVADYTPAVYHKQKVKKQPGSQVLELERTKDILMALGNEKQQHQVLVGFAAETEKLDEYAIGKLQRKNADMIVANNVTVSGAGFGTDTNIVTIYKKDGSKMELPQMSKQQVAKVILDEVTAMLNGNNRP
ncbi:bifunctional phosphopantothenoylcysteine decarboxylase/phosphopantothenate--cysteine ligase CoaBC [Peribacillus saganii]|uniref:Coenzyme A biosynthesis bifunctional protein CoaBC n=1 Tax=Peribacillus saganii TaxID=2303992 RepID=A0A372LBI4_9BACI|nr:bifunctional phosphopantothenoylcysteine decarboxylase/phosphopantothenate--cysteine ligase CoaBC [Peribacillus saganii]RFU63217.1 bifunctional phosphopantothenoylcysteine decarboxylase/phosphopantothenate--cysteine ligase CoaBC [Peribacillus saganii]